jgi:hypothetical protein
LGNPVVARVSRAKEFAADTAAATALNPQLQTINCSRLFLVRGHFRQLRREEAFLFFLVQKRACGRDETRGHENNQITFGVLINVGRK